MKRSLSELIFADCLFIVFLSLSYALGGVAGSVLYAASFILPVTLLIFLWRREEREDYKISVSFSRPALRLTASFAFPIILAVLLISFITSTIMGALGVEDVVSDFDGNIFYLITVRALAPAIFEEMLFRYFPIRALGAHSPRLTVIYSSVLFSLAHCNIFQIPYALFAGAAFAALDIAAGSVIPSILIHFLSNVLSIVWQRGNDNTVFVIIFLSAIFLLAAISALVIFSKRKKLKEEFSPVLQDKSKVIFTYPLVLYIVMTIVVAMSALLI